VPILAFIIYLLLFHAWISYHGFSTYEYILWTRIKERLHKKIKVITINLQFALDRRIDEEGVRELEDENYTQEHIVV
jgi:hypothetical protein